MVSYTLFETPLGTCGIAWTSHGIRHIELPDKSVAATEARLSRHAQPSAPPAHVKRVIERLVAHLSGQPQDFADVELDLNGVSPFYREVYASARQIGCGQVQSYGDLAGALGKKGAARAVGQALSRNPVPVVVPCHRVIAHGNRTGGFSAPGGGDTKLRMLALEGVTLREPDSLWSGNLMRKAVQHLGKDKVMRQILQAVGPCALADSHPNDPFGALCESVIYQQLAGSAARAITARYLALQSPPRFPDAAELMRLTDEALRGVGLSSGKVRTLRALAAAALDGSLPLHRLASMENEAVRQCLVAIKGIGPWTADMLLIFHLGRPDVFPVGDLGIRKAMQKAYGLPDLPDAARMEKLAHSWKPYRTVATWYLWRSLGVVTL